MKNRRTITFRIPSSRPPIFRLGDQLFIDNAFDFGQRLEVSIDYLIDFIQHHRSEIVIARPLTPTEAALAEKKRHDSDHEAAANILRDGGWRWCRARR